MKPEVFVHRWKGKASGAAESSNYSLFLTELCDLLDVPHPDPARPENDLNAYVFQRRVVFQHGDGTTSTGFIDLYKRGSFVLEAKQGIEEELRKEDGPALFAPRSPRRSSAVSRGTPRWDRLMVQARNQAEGYARALPAAEGRPPFILVVDVGHTIEVHSEFTCTGGIYVPFPDARSHRIPLSALLQEETRSLLRKIWLDPMSLDSSRESARVTREVAQHLALLARSLEDAGHPAQVVSDFLMRAIFTMFSEDVGLIPESGFSGLLEALRDQPESFVAAVEELWRAMKEGGFSTSLRAKVKHFNGHLFEEATALQLTREQLSLLADAARMNWRDVEPAIFGTLLERALDPVERRKLGAHFTPRDYVERLVIPTVIEPLREEWRAVQATALTYQEQGELGKAQAEIDAFHDRLCKVRVLDPACGSGNFLYVALEHLKRLEGEVLDALRSLGEKTAHLEALGITVDPRQFWGLEVNPRAAPIADLVLWIGYLQWHLRTSGSADPPEPIIRPVRNVILRDAVLTWKREEPVLDENGLPVTRWDGRTTVLHPRTGREVPDESARVPVLRLTDPHPAEWPAADFVVGNPPHIGNSRMRRELGDGYAEAIRAAHPDLPETCDYVMYWWDHAARLVREGRIRRFGFITTNSLRQTHNRRILSLHLDAQDPVSLLFAIPDHPWVDAADGAAVRVAMTVVGPGEQPGRLLTVESEEPSGDLGRRVTLSERQGRIQADLTIGPRVADAVPLKANDRISCPGVKLHGSGFIVTAEGAEELGLGRIPGLEDHIRPYRNGRDLTQTPRGVFVIDLFGLAEAEVRERFPEVYQWILERVKPDRDANPREIRRRNWWIFGEPISTFRPLLEPLRRYIATAETAKHRFFVFLERSILPDNMVINVALDDAYVLGVLSCRIHVTWALAAGGRLGVGNDARYNKTRCFETFPFPDAPEEIEQRIRDLGEALDAHRKRQQDLHDSFTLTSMYNVLAALRAGKDLSGEEREIHEQGLVSVLRTIHDDLDAAVAEAYRWPSDLPNEEILERLVALNAERAKEEREGLVRWLRPEVQSAGAVQVAIDAKAGPRRTPSRRAPWPASLVDQVRAASAALAQAPGPLRDTEVARRFTRAPASRVREIMEALVAVGQARRLPDGRYARS